MSCHDSGTPPVRSVVIAVDLSDQSMKAAQWAACEFCRPGDVAYLVHVSRVLSPQTQIHHAYAGSSYQVPDTHPIDEQQHAQTIRDIIQSRFTAEFEKRGIEYAVEIFLDTDNAPASAVCSSVWKVAEQVGACVVVMASHNKAYGWDSFLLGSVAEYATQNSVFPLMLIRDYTLPFVIRTSAGGHPPHVQKE